MNPHTFPKGHFALLMKVNIMAASIEVNEVIKVGGIQNTLVLWQAVFLAASPLAMAAPPPKLYFALSRSPYRQLRRLAMERAPCLVIINLDFIVLSLIYFSPCCFDLKDFNLT